MPNFSSVALFVQTLFSWGNFTPPQLFNVHKKTPNWERVNSYCYFSYFYVNVFQKLELSIQNEINMFLNRLPLYFYINEV